MPFPEHLSQQSAPDACGAFALGAALMGAGEEQHAHTLDIANLQNGYIAEEPIAIRPANHTTFSEDIYRVTGNLDPQGNPASYVAGGFRNSPSALVYVASLFGYGADHITVFHTDTEVIQGFQLLPVANPGAVGSLFLTEVNLIDDRATVDSGPGDNYTPPQENNIHIVLVDEGNHWIAVNQTHMYDPANANPGNIQPINIEEINGRFSGLWIELRN